MLDFVCIALICFGYGAGRKCCFPNSSGIMKSVSGYGIEVLCANTILWVVRISFENGIILARLVGFVLIRDLRSELE